MRYVFVILCRSVYLVYPTSLSESGGHAIGW